MQFLVMRRFTGPKCCIWQEPSVFTKTQILDVFLTKNLPTVGYFGIIEEIFAYCPNSPNIKGRFSNVAHGRTDYKTGPRTALYQLVEVYIVVHFTLKEPILIILAPLPLSHESHHCL